MSPVRAGTMLVQFCFSLPASGGSPPPPPSLLTFTKLFLSVKHGAEAFMDKFVYMIFLRCRMRLYTDKLMVS